MANTVCCVVYETLLDASGGVCGHVSRERCCVLPRVSCETFSGSKVHLVGLNRRGLEGLLQQGLGYRGVLVEG